jgi:hypothetical protein
MLTIVYAVPAATFTLAESVGGAVEAAPLLLIATVYCPVGTAV